ncbi:hypothetical protein WMY93_001935 [Mugilogobius chulae]|uniref:Uncharacterized protein n=1 Tax=Mugilogobius chulae TaxID=88201 RepID=A0AAW0Q395_9GOBI
MSLDLNPHRNVWDLFRLRVRRHSEERRRPGPALGVQLMGNIWVIVGRTPTSWKPAHISKNTALTSGCSCQDCGERDRPGSTGAGPESRVKTSAKDSTCRIPASDNGFWDEEEETVP